MSSRAIKKAVTSDGQEVCLSLEEGRSWQGFVLTGLPEPHRKKHENKPKALSAAVMVWNRVVRREDRVTVGEVSVALHGQPRLQ